MTTPRPLSMPSFARRYRITGAVTLIAIYFLFLVGAIVRATGAGMGCPDWPKCFGRWIPPTTASALPPDYLTTYRDQRLVKNERVANRLDGLGFHATAERLRRNPTAFLETEFNATKTWIEYLNRLVGAVTGLLIVLTFWRSLAYWRCDRVVTLCTGLAVLVVGVQGWLGSLVVSTNLMPAIITWHMGLGLGLLALLHYALYRTRPADTPLPATAGFLRPLVVGLAVLTFLQILLGTQVREQIDQISAHFNYLNRDLWIERLGREFGWHRAFSTVLLLANVYVGWLLWHTGQANLRRLAAWLGVLIVGNMLVGLALSRLAMPPTLQPVHLTVATLLFGVQVMTLLALLPGTAAPQRAAEEDERGYLAADLVTETRA